MPKSTAGLVGIKKYTQPQIIKAIKDARGMVYVAARALNVSNDTLYRWKRTYPAIEAAIFEARGHFIDKCEHALEDAVDRGEGWAVCFALKCLGKDRGYVERVELVGKDGGPVTIALQWADGTAVEDGNGATTNHNYLTIASSGAK